MMDKQSTSLEWQFLNGELFCLEYSIQFFVLKAIP